MELVSLPNTAMSLYIPERLVVVIQSLVVESSEQESLLVENVPYPLAEQLILMIVPTIVYILDTSGHLTNMPTKMEMDEADENEKQRILKKKSFLRGTSDYQNLVLMMIIMV
ncbi:hypothetical protein V2J09_001024 [Rumex salicifolius]